MGQEVFISICIPAYNRRVYLNRLLDSILIQSWRDYEVVITDDSPGNEIQDLVLTHQLAPAIRYFRNGHPLGTPENWNEALWKAKGAWIKLMHDDDWFGDAGSLSAFVHSLKEQKGNFHFSAYDNVFPDGRSKRISPPRGFLRKLNRSPEILLAANRIGPPSAVIFRNDPGIVFDRKLKWLVDLDFYIHYLKVHPPAVYIPESLVRIGISDSQVTQVSFGNREVEIPERLRVWGKIKDHSTRSLQVYDSWWRFVRNLKIKDPEELSAAQEDGSKIPVFVISMIRWQKNIPRRLLKQGPFSKAVMFLHYLTHER